MMYSIDLSPEADNDLAAMRAFDRAEILDAIDRYLAYTPTSISRSRIKRLRLLESPAYRLRIGNYRVHDDVDDSLLKVRVLRILSKADSLDYLQGVGGEA